MWSSIRLRLAAASCDMATSNGWTPYTSCCCATVGEHGEESTEGEQRFSTTVCGDTLEHVLHRLRLSVQSSRFIRQPPTLAVGFVLCT